MQQQIDLKELERKVWTSFFQDGIWDIYLGLLLMATAISAFLSDTGLTGKYSIIVHLGIITLAMVFLLFGKRLITIPRMGKVIFGPKGKARISKVVVIMTISCFLGLVAFMMVSLVRGNTMVRQPIMDYIFPLFWALTMIVLFSLAAFFLNYNRLYIIGLMYATVVPADKIIHKLLHIDLSSVAFGIPALVILIMGFIVLIRFLKKYPRPRVEEQNVRV